MVPLARCLSGQETIARQRDLDPVEFLRVDARFRVALHKSRDRQRVRLSRLLPVLD
jgi:hypothetical protein